MANFMVVDDSKLARRVVVELLNTMAHTVSLEAASGEEAISIYDPVAVDCILLDVEMGGISGLEVTKILKEKYENIKIIIVSSVSEANRLKEAVLCGADMIIQKPINAIRLQHAIEKVLGHI